MMKSLLVVLSAAVVTALSVYFGFAACGAFGLMSSAVVVDVDLFILLFAMLTLGSALLAVLLRAAVARSDERLVRRLEQRIASLEQDEPSGPAHPAV